jgi:ferrochelatase
VVEEFHTHPIYIQALVEKIAISLTHFDDPSKVHLLFSAHGLPLSLIERGDPYQRQVEETMRAVLQRGGWPNANTLCYQSRVGRQKWLEPSLDQTIPRLAQAGEKRLLVIPLSFVTEHIETLHEINMEARHEALAAGIEQFEMMPALGDSPRFIEAIAGLVRSAAVTALNGTAPETASFAHHGLKSP